MTTTVSYNEIERIVYMPLPDGLADVWLHKNIKQIKDEDGNTAWTADEVYFRTAKSEEEIEKDFDEIFENGGTGETFDPTPEDGEPDTPETSTVTARLDELEELIVQLAEIQVSEGNLLLEDIPENLQDQVRVKIDDDKWIDK